MNTSRLKNTIKTTLAGIIFSFCLILPVQAADSTISVQINNTAEIILNGNDTFIVTCEAEDGRTEELYIQAIYYTATNEYPIDEGSYTVTAVQYVGDQTAIEETSIAISRHFSTHDDAKADNILYIAVGETAITAVQDAGIDVTYIEELDPESVASDPPDSLPDTNVSEEVPSEVSESDMASAEDEAVVIYYNEQDDSLMGATKHTLRRLAIMLSISAILATGCLGFLLYLHRKGRI